MKAIKAVTPDFLWIVVGLLALGASLPMSGYQQGSYFLFDIRDDAEQAEGLGGRIAVASSVFKKDASLLKTEIAGKRKKSEFESEISSFNLEGSDSVSTGIEILDEKKDDSETESSFGESKPAPGGFFFSY